MPHEFDARKYEQASAPQKEWGLQLIDQLGLTGTEYVLDLGCGDGALTAQLATRVPAGRVVGIDASVAMVARATEKHVAQNLTFLLQDINTMDFEQEFDIIYSNATLHWVADHANLLARVVRALRPGGVLRFSFAGAGNCRTLLAVLRKAMSQPEFAPHFAGFTWPWTMPDVVAYQDLMQANPFVELRVWNENADRHFPNATALTAWIDQPTLVPFLPPLPPALRDPFRDTVVESMLAATREADGRHFETFRRLNVFAQL